MASVRRIPGSRYWIACFTDQNGRQRQRSTKETDRRKALKRAEEFESAYRRLISEAQARRVLSDIYQEIHGEKLVSATVRDFLTNWVSRKEVEASKKTHEKYQSVIRRLLTHLGDKADRDLSFVTVQDLTLFRDKMARELSPSSANVALKIVRTAFQDALRNGLLQNNPASLVPTIKRKAEPSSERRPFSKEELRALLANADEEWKGIILCGLYTGQRLGDIARLTSDLIDLDREEISLWTGKTRRRVILPLAQPLKEYFSDRKLEAGSKPLFPRAYSIVAPHGRVGTLSNQFYQIMVNAGIAPKRPHRAAKEGRSGKREANTLSFHCLRHTATSLLKNAGVSEAVAMDIIAHDSKAISANYTHIESDAKRAALDKLPSLDEIQ